jgi:large subunit ribosomal protein L18
MAKIQHQYSTTTRRRLRVRAKVKATPTRPKLTISRSNRFIYLQVIDHTGRVLTTASDQALARHSELPASLTKTARAQHVATALLTNLKNKKITTLAVDRGAYKYAGRVKAAVEIIRAGGVEV